VRHFMELLDSVLNGCWDEGVAYESGRVVAGGCDQFRAF
jgi:hypothetical protein